jgi:hypothetical protein
MKKNITITGVLTLLLMLTAQLTFAQPGPGGPPIPAAVPLDGGLSLLLIAGAAFGAKSLRK